MLKTVLYNRNRKQMSEREKRSFLSKLKNGNHQAYRKLYNLYGKEIFGYIRAYFPYDQHTAEDVLQEVFITAYTKISSLKDINKIREWLYRIASRKCVDFKRKEKTEIKYMKEYWENINILNQKSVEDKVIEKELFNILINEARKLPDFLREVYLLRVHQNLPYQEIAEITKTSLSRVKKAMKKAVSKLLEQLKKKNIEKDILFK